MLYVVLRLDPAIKRVGQIIAVYPKPNDNFLPMFPQSMDLHHILLEIIDISNQKELNMLKISLGDLALKSEAGTEKWNITLLAVTNIFTEINIKPTLYKGRNTNT